MGSQCRTVRRPVRPTVEKGRALSENPGCSGEEAPLGRRTHVNDSDEFGNRADESCPEPYVQYALALVGAGQMLDGLRRPNPGKQKWRAR